MQLWILACTLFLSGAGQSCLCPAAAATLLWQTQDLESGKEPAGVVHPDWTELPQAQPDYLPPGFRFVRFPAEFVCWVYLAERAENGWRIKKDSYPYWNASSLANCSVGIAKGRIALPINQPLLLKTTAKDLSFLEDIPSETFVAISASRSKGTLSNFRRLIATHAEQIHFPDPDPAARSELKQLPIGDRLKYSRQTRSEHLASWLANSSSLVRFKERLSLYPCWEGQDSIRSLHLDMSLRGVQPKLREMEHASLRIAGTMDKLRDLSVKYSSGPITAVRIAPLADLGDLAGLNAIDLELASEVPLGRDCVKELCKMKNLRRLAFTKIAPDAYPLLKDLPMRVMSRRGSSDEVYDPNLARALAGIRTLKEFPALAVPPEALEALKNRNDIEALDLRAPPGEVKFSRIYEEIVLANPGLRRLKLSRLEVDDSLCAAIAGCSKLESLVFGRVKMIGKNDFVGEFPVLRDLQLSASNAGRGEAALKIRCPEVRNVKISERWHWSTTDLLRDCPKVERLTLGLQFNLVGDAGGFDSKFVALLGGMPNLWDLNVSSIEVTPEDVPLLAKLSGLVRLDIEGKLAPAELLPLRDLRMLRRLVIRDSGVSPSDAKRLSELFRGRGVDFRNRPTVAELKKVAERNRDRETGWNYPCVWSRHTNIAWYFEDPKVIELCNAIDQQDTIRVRELLVQGVDADFRGKRGVTPLMWCMPITDTGVFDLLLANGADPNVKCQAAFAGSPMVRGDSVTSLVASFCKAKALRAVLDHGGDPNFDGLRSCLASAVGVAGFRVEERIAKVRLLLDRGANPNAKVRGSSVLTQALQGKHLECALVLLAAGADPKLDEDNPVATLLPCHHVAVLQDASDLSPVDQERVLLLTEKLKRQKAWRPNAKAEITEVRRLEGQHRFDAAKEYMNARWGQRDNQ